MAAEIVMPRLSDSMEEGTILSWLVAPGDEIAPGQPLAEIETDKATVTYEADDAGVILSLRAAEGSTVPVGAVIAMLGEPGEDPPAEEDAAVAAEQPVAVGVGERAGVTGRRPDQPAIRAGSEASAASEASAESAAQAGSAAHAELAAARAASPLRGAEGVQKRPRSRGGLRHSSAST